MSKLDTLVVDNTGPLTAGKPRLNEIQAVNGAEAGQVQCLAAQLELAFGPPVGRTIVEAATSRESSTVRSRPMWK